MPTTHTVPSVPSFGAVILASALALAAPATPLHAQQPSAARLTTRGTAAIRDSVKKVLDRALADSAFPGGIAVVGTRTRVLAQYAVGHLDWAPSPKPNEHTIWDLASLSKVIGLTSGIMQLVGTPTCGASRRWSPTTTRC